ncbi:MAG: hypothetical protein AAGH65_09940 [Pseudomonadota bacterium]
MKRALQWLWQRGVQTIPMLSIVYAAYLDWAELMTRLSTGAG